MPIALPAVGLEHAASSDAVSVARQPQQSSRTGRNLHAWSKGMARGSSSGTTAKRQVQGQLHFSAADINFVTIHQHCQ